MQQGGWGPQAGGAPPPGGGYGAPPPPGGGGYGAPPPPGGGYGGPPQGAPPGPPPGMPPGYQPQASMDASDGKKGFFGALFDFSFSAFVTTKMIKFLYVLWMLGVIVIILGGLIGGVMEMTSRYGSVLTGLLAIIFSPVAALLWLIIGRMYFELIIVAFRIAEYLEEINRKTKG